MTPRDWLIAVAFVGLVAVAYIIRPKDSDAWVLWEKRMTFKGETEASTWEPLDGFGSLAACQASGETILKGGLDFMKSGGRKLLSVRPDGRSALYETSEGSSQQTVDTRLLCFPGPFDPRTPVPKT